MKIALVSPYDFAQPGGVTNHIACLERQFTRMGHEVKIIAPASRTITTFGDRFIPIGKPRSIPSNGSVARITLSLTLSSTVKSVLEKEKFDIIHLHEPLCPTLCTTVLRFSQTANVGTFHACESWPHLLWAKPLGMLMLLKKWSRNLHGKIAVSKPAMEFANRLFPGHYDIIPNGIDLEHFSNNVSPIDEFCDGKLNVLFVGRMEKRKGANYLLKAYKQVKQEIPESRLILVGPGVRLRHKYEKHVAKNGLRDVIFTGHVAYDELPRYYKTADIFCTPAIGYESFGIVLLEAMALGKPVVASNIGGYASVLTRGAEGLLVTPKNEATLAQALISLMNDKSLRQQMGAKGKLKAAEYGWERIAQRVLDYYAKVLGEFQHKEQA